MLTYQLQHWPRRNGRISLTKGLLAICADWQESMKTRILIEENDVRITFSPETELERLCIRDLGDDISVSHSHKDIVLKRRHSNVRRIDDAEPKLDTPNEELAQG
jgi:hypothetical protein